MYEFKDGHHIIEEETTIARQPSEVFAFITEADNILLFWSNMIRYEHLSTPLEKGVRASATLRLAGRKLDWTAELIEMEPDRLLAWRSVDAPFPFHYEYRLEPVDTGTKVIYHLDSEEVGGFFGRIADPIVGRMMSRDTRSNLEHLKDLLEGEIQE